MLTYVIPSFQGAAQQLAQALSRLSSGGVLNYSHTQLVKAALMFMGEGNLDFAGALGHQVHIQRCSSQAALDR